MCVCVLPTLLQVELTQAGPGLSGWSRAASSLSVCTAVVEVQTQQQILWSREVKTQKQTLLTHH